MDNTNLKLLIVDDEEDLCVHTKSFFQRRKFPVFVARNGRDAFEIAKQENPSLILLDMSLGDTNGIDLLKKLRQENLASKVIMITGFLLDDSTQEVLKQLNVFKYFQKPVMLDKLEEAVKQALEIK